ncbi:MAG: patatin-like phospholipase family protein [Proteobacteria bacterium]|nr:MAG: patatin-like phospholipase family protein [Pseudomonadota bacterium]
MTERREVISKRKKVAFVCSGGATKAAAFHMGVGLALQEKGFRFVGGLKSKKAHLGPRTHMDIDSYVGSSAGSIIAAYLAAGYSVDQIFNAFLGKKKDSPLKPMSYSTLMSVKSSQHEDATREGLTKRLRSLTTNAIDLIYRRQRLLSMNGLFTTAGIEEYMREDVLPSNKFQDYLPDLCIVATQLNHSKRVIFSNNKLPTPADDPGCIYETQVAISDAVAASVALPPIFAPYGIKNSNGKIIYFFDGEIRETLSVNAAEQGGADLIIASYTHQPYHFSREIGSLTKFGITAIGIQAIYLMIERKIQSSIFARNQKLAALEAVNEYCKDHLDEKHRRKIMNILESELVVAPENRYIYINPRARDHEMFFGDHFNFSSKFMEKIVRGGFMAAIETLRRYEFEK